MDSMFFHKCSLGIQSQRSTIITSLFSVFLIVASLFFTTYTIPAKASSPFVTARGTMLWLNGAPYKFLGVNRYNILTKGRPYRGCGSSWSQSDLDTWFAEVHQMGGNAVRFWAFQQFTANGTDFSGLDYVVNTLASKYSIKVILVLENQWKDCTQDGYKYDSWYRTGYLAPYGSYTLSYKQYLNVIIPRYRNSSNILMWQLMNEAEDKKTDGSCASGANLYNFASDVSSYIKSLDPNHLVSLGTIGGSQCGINGNAYKNLHSLPTIDVVEAHDYATETSALPGSDISEVLGQVYVQDHTWTWSTPTNAKGTHLGTWTTYTGTIDPTAIAPLHRVGLTIAITSSWRGSIYLDKITIGSTSYTFEDGTIQGWQTSGTIFSGLSQTTNQIYEGKHALAVTFNGTTGSGQVWINAPASAHAGTPVTFYVYTPGTAPMSTARSIASDLQVAKNLNKPFFIGEAGIQSDCGAANCYTQSQRATYFADKIAALYANGGSGFLIWSYRDNMGQLLATYDFNASDPLYQRVQTITR